MINAPVPVTVTRNGGLAVVTVDSPPLNLFDMAMRDALVATVEELERTSPRAVLFRFEGKVVTGGVDVHVFDAISDAGEATALFAGLVATAQRVAALRCPTVFAAHGLCLTWGFELALACDLILASERASFGLIEATVGLTPAMGGTQRLAERAGSGRARELVMSADRYDATTLHQWGVVNRVLPADGFDAAARQFAEACGKTPVEVKDQAGFIVNALLFPYLNNAVRLYEQGVASVEDIDTAMKGGCGFPMGPFALLDLVGLDTSLAILDALYDEFRDPNYAAVPLLRRMVTAELLGRKSGQGFLDYRKGR